MSDVVIAALIPAIASVVAQLVISDSKKRESDARMAQHEQKQQDTLDDLRAELVEVKKRLDQHNGYAEKFANASKDIALIQKDLEYIKKR